MLRTRQFRVLSCCAGALVALSGLATSAKAQTYCDANTTNTFCSTFYEYISNVSLADLNDTRPCGVPGYEDRTSVIANMAPGSTGTFSITIGSYWQTDHVMVFIDWDNNGTLDDPGEATEVTAGPDAGQGDSSMTYTASITVPASATIGAHRMRVFLDYGEDATPCTTGGDFGQVKDYTIVTANPDDPSISGGSATAVVGSQVLLTAAAQPGQNPASTSLSVTANLTSVGGSATQTMYDDGTHGDAVAHDNTFSLQYSVPHAPAQSAGIFNLPVTVTDDLSRTGSGAIGLTLTAEPVGGCCVAGVCSVNTAYNCGNSSGTYRGDGTDCGAVSYTLGPSSGTYVDISSTGTQLTGIACDDCYQNVALPFTFSFYEGNYTNVAVASNGFLTFATVADGDFAEYANDTPPSAGTPNNAIYPLWDDMILTTSGAVYTQTDGAAPNRTFTINWVNCPKFSTGEIQNFEAVLYEGSNNIEFRYGSISADAGDTNGSATGPGGGDRTVGIEDDAGVRAVTLPTSANLGTGGTALMVTYSSSPVCAPTCGSADFNCDGDTGTDADIEAFFACLAGNCPGGSCPSNADFNADGDTGTDADIEAFFRVLAGGNC